MQELKEGYEDHIKQPQEKNSLLKWNLEESQGINLNKEDTIKTL